MATGEGTLEEDTKDSDGNYVPKYITPVKLTHYYMQINAENKLDTLFSFIKSHKHSKCIVFFSSCKQVRHAYESFSKLKIGVSLMEIHGRQKQVKRTAIYFEFVERKNAYLFATDIASRGMDFPAVDWVIQVDLPEDTDTYIHRVGRTARYKYKGSALLMILPGEMKFVSSLKSLNISMKQLSANPSKTLSITSALQRTCASNSDLMHLSQKAFICYIRSIFKNKDKDIFNIQNINHEAFAASLGLATTPVIEFIQPSNSKKKSKLQKLREKIEIKKQKTEENDDNLLLDEDQLFTVKRTIMPDEGIEEAEEIKPIFSKNKLKKIKRGGIADGKNKIYFDNDGQPITSLEYHMKHNTFTKDNQDQTGKDDQETDYFDKVKKSLQANKNIDDQIANERVKQKRIKKRKQKEEYRKQLEQENQKEFYVVEGEDNDDDDDDDEGED